MDEKKIIPAILPEDFFDLRRHLERVKGAANYVQIDICNGSYTPSKTWPFTHLPDIYFDKMLSGEEGMPFWEDVDFELDLMIEKPEQWYEKFLQLGPKRIIFHIETLSDPTAYLKKIKQEGIVEVGIAFSNDTNPLDYKEAIAIADVVQCMGIKHIGYQGQNFDERIIGQVEKIRREFPSKLIAADGGVNENTIFDLSGAGVNHFVIGSAFFKKENLIEAMKDFKFLV